MSATPLLFDRMALTRHRARVAPDALFLHHGALAEVQDRLELVNRAFKSVGIVTAFPDIWGAAFPEATIVPDDEVLGLEPGAHDLVVHAMALHWANDPVGQIIQCRRAMKPDGLFLGVMLGGRTLSELRMALAEAEAKVSGGLSPRVAPMAEIRDLGGLLQRGGLALPVVDGFETVAEYRDIRHLMRDLRAMGETNALSARLRRFTGRTVFDAAQSVYDAHFRQPGSDRLRATFETLCLTGWVPDENQPKPLRPGSATARLAEALGTRETTLRD